MAQAGASLTRTGVDGGLPGPRYLVAVIVLRLSLILALSALALASASAAGAGGRASGSSAYARFVAPDDVCTGASAPATSPAEATTVMTCLVNVARQRRGLRTLTTSPVLQKAAALKLSGDQSCNEFSHTPCGSPFTTVYKLVGYTKGSWSIGENLAWGQDELGTPAAILQAWLESPGHRENLFSSEWREMGIAFAQPQSFVGYQGVSLWANSFGVQKTG